MRFGKSPIETLPWLSSRHPTHSGKTFFETFHHDKPPPKTGCFSRPREVLLRQVRQVRQETNEKTAIWHCFSGRSVWSHLSHLSQLSEYLSKICHKQANLPPFCSSHLSRLSQLLKSSKNRQVSCLSHRVCLTCLTCLNVSVGPLWLWKSLVSLGWLLAGFWLALGWLLAIKKKVWWASDAAPRCGQREAAAAGEGKRDALPHRPDSLLTAMLSKLDNGDMPPLDQERHHHFQIHFFGVGTSCFLAHASSARLFGRRRSAPEGHCRWRGPRRPRNTRSVPRQLMEYQHPDRLRLARAVLKG